MNIKISILFLLFSIVVVGQKKTIAKKPKIEHYLIEFSGLVALNDSLFIAHNDGGNKPILYCLTSEKKILNQVYIKNAKNIDWEDITIDDSNRLYIGDIGNNENKRKDLCIYVVNASRILETDSLEAKKISFSYSDQKQFPPEEKSVLHFDAEALDYYKGKLWIFTKSHSKPFDGISKAYSLTIDDTIQVAKLEQKLKFKARSFRKDAITAADSYGNKMFLLSYSHIYVLHDYGAAWIPLYKRRLWIPAQREALCVSKNYFYTGNEKVKWIFKAKLRKIKRRRK
jgi:hypothetical protein